MEHPEEHYYKLNRFLLSISGLWPYQSLRNARIIRVALTIYIISIIFVQVASATTNTINMDYMVDLIALLLPTSGSLFYLYARAIYIDNLRDLMDRIWKDWKMKKTKPEYTIMHKSAQMSKLFTFYYMFPIFLLLGIYIIVTSPEFLDIVWPRNETRPRTIAITVRYFIDEERYTYFIRLHLYTGLILSTFIFTAGCTTFMFLTQHICGICELIGYRAQRLFSVQRKTKHETRRKVADLIRLHYKVIQFVNIIENFHTIPFLLDFVGIMIITGMTLTQILSAGDPETIMRSIGFTFVLIYYIFVSNYMGQKVTDMNWKVCEKLYSPAWYNTHITEQKSLLLIMRRCFQPLVFTACKFYPLSLQSFGMIIQTAISYCIFVRSI